MTAGLFSGGWLEFWIVSVLGLVLIFVLVIMVNRRRYIQNLVNEIVGRASARAEL